MGAAIGVMWEVTVIWGEYRAANTGMYWISM
jgi:hypothetical protein